jgi:hypothetical protein
MRPVNNLLMLPWRNNEHKNLTSEKITVEMTNLLKQQSEERHEFESGIFSKAIRHHQEVHC